MNRFTVAAFLSCCVLARVAAAEVSSETILRLERASRSHQNVRPDVQVRGLFAFVLQAADAGWKPEAVERALELAEQMQDRDAGSPTYGNFRWYWRDAKPGDRNAVEFSMQIGSLLWLLHRDNLSATSRERLERLIRFSVEGIRRHKVSESYTNIFLMKTWNCIAIGEATGRPDLADEGYQMLDRWLMYTWECGVHEYLSPTYYGTDLSSLGLIARFAKRESGRRAAQAILRLFWTDIAANWYEPGKRLGGAHSRDYDYLTGHGALDPFLKMAEWMDGADPRGTDVFMRLCEWTPPVEARASVEARTPRFVRQRWGPEPWNTAAQHVGKRFSIGSAGAAYGTMDKTLVVNLPGGPATPVVSFFMDARGDAYGKMKILEGASGHQKALHIEPFVTNVQRGPEVLLLASADPASKTFKKGAPDPTCLLSHVVIPASVAVWIGDKRMEPLRAGERIEVNRTAPVFLRIEDVAVGVRFPLTIATSGKQAAIELVNDGARYGALRLTCVHSATKPEGRGVVGVWVRAAEGLDDTAFARFRAEFTRAETNSAMKGDLVELRAAGLSGPLRLAADVAREQRRVREGVEPGGEKYLLAVNGRDVGREILQDVDPIPKYRRTLETAEQGGPSAIEPEEVFEAEDAAVIVPPFQVDRDADASGGKFIWVPGEPGGKGGSSVARAVWMVHIPKTGSYFLWARVLTPTPNDDSFFVSVRQLNEESLPQPEWSTGIHTTWEWSRVQAKRGKEEKATSSIALSEGLATIEFRCREDGTRLDALFLTADPNAMPPERQ